MASTLSSSALHGYGFPTIASLPPSPSPSALFPATLPLPFPSLRLPASEFLSSTPARPRKFACRSSIGGAPGGTGALTPELKEALDKYVTSNKVVLFMKGTKMFPQCGFSNTVVQVLNSLNVPYETVNILEDEGLRAGLKVYSNWPTFPQLYVDGEFFGGCDITLEAYKSGELQETVEKAMCS